MLSSTAIPLSAQAPTRLAEGGWAAQPRPVSLTEWPDSSAAAVSTTLRQDEARGYLILEGEVESNFEEGGLYVDLYKVYPDGRRELARTLRSHNGRYKLYLQRGYEHAILLKMHGYETEAILLSAQETQSAAGIVRKRHQLRRPVAALHKEISPLSVPNQDIAMPVRVSLVAEERMPTPCDAKLQQKAVLREGLGAHTAHMVELPAGTHVRILEYTTTERWMIAYEDHIGWLPAAAF